MSSTSGDTLDIYAPLSGVIVPLEKVPDDAFAQRLAGDGIAIDPLSNQVLAPCDAHVLQVHRARHALTLDAAGLEIIIHVGLDTVGLKGDGFTPLVRAGDEVRRGQPLLSFDADRVARSARSLISVVLVANMDRVASIERRTGMVEAGRDVLMRVNVAGEGATRATRPEPSAAAVTSAPISVRARTGLHARPAATIAAAARKFASDLRIRKGSDSANARSVVSIMALEVENGDSVVVEATGIDAADAVSALEALLRTDLDSSGSASSLQATSSPISAMPWAGVSEDDVLRGVSASPGVSIGSVFHLRRSDIPVEEHATDPAAERSALGAALAGAQQQLEALRIRMEAEADSNRAAIFAAHQELLADPEVLDRVNDDISAGASAAFAWRKAYTEQSSRLTALKNPVLAGRAADLRDVGRRVLHLLTGRDGTVQPIPAGSIVIAEDLAPSDAASLDPTHVLGLCMTMGGASSHVAILARGLGIPAVAGTDPRVLDLPDGARVVLDGDAGIVRLTDGKRDEEQIADRQASSELRRTNELAVASAPAVTTDGKRIEVVANIGTVAETAHAVEVGSEGVGLLRSEFLFMHRDTAPGEAEQVKAYSSIARTLGGDRLLVVRTLDIGGDKPVSYMQLGAEANPFLGERGVRLTLNHPAMFRTQIRAILRASADGRIAMMFPMIATMAEWRAARAMVEEERVKLGVAHVPVGIMVETASAAVMAERLARDADFLSIGTNDLTQYTLAMDRNNPRLAAQIDGLHPSVLRMIEMTVRGAHAHKRWVGVCGGLASDLSAVPVLLGLGVDELSADVPIVPAIKARVRALSANECRETAMQALECADAAEVRALVARRHG